MDPYEVLGVPRDAPTPEIRKRYLDLARRFHPDAQTGAGAHERAGAERRMQEVNAAWAILGDADARRRHDLGIPDTAQGPEGAEPVVRRPPSPGWRPRSDDDGWMDDFASWRDEVDDVVPPERPVTAGRSTLTLAPVASLTIGVVLAMAGLVLSLRPLVAAGLVALIASALLFVFVPLLLMLQDQDR